MRINNCLLMFMFVLLWAATGGMSLAISTKELFRKVASEEDGVGLDQGALAVRTFRAKRLYGFGAKFKKAGCKEFKEFNVSLPGL